MTEPLQVDTDGLDAASAILKSAAGQIPTQLPQFSVNGSDPLSAAIAAGSAQMEAPMAALPGIKANATSVAEKTGVAGQRYRSTDEMLAEKARQHLFHHDDAGQKAVTDQLVGNAAGAGTGGQSPLSGSILANVTGGGTATDAANSALHQIGKAAAGEKKDWLIGVPAGYAGALTNQWSSELAKLGAKGEPSLAQKALSEIKLGEKASLGTAPGIGLGGLFAGVNYGLDMQKPGMTSAHAAVRNGAALVVGTLAQAPFDATGVGIPAGILVGTGASNLTAALVDAAWEPVAQSVERVRDLGGSASVVLSHRGFG